LTENENENENIPKRN